MKESTVIPLIHANTALIYAFTQAALDRAFLSIWTVYDHPKEYPDTFVARCFEVGSGLSGPTDDVVTGTLDIIRRSMEM